jgi:anti-sigma B factor antagonist
VGADRDRGDAVRTGEIALERDGEGFAVLSVKGEHDLSTAPDLRRQLDELIDGGEPTVVDLSAATFVDSSVLGAILDARRSAGEAGVGFAVAQAANGAEAVSRVLDITGLRAELPVHPDRGSAVTAATQDDA